MTMAPSGSSNAPSTWVARQGSSRIQRTAPAGTTVPSPPRRHHADPAFCTGCPTERHRRRTPMAAGRRTVGDSMNATCVAVTPMSCCQVARSSSTAWADSNAPAASHSPSRRKIPSPSSTGPSSTLPSSTPNRTLPPPAACRCTCDAMGMVSPPVNSCGARNREYCSGIPDSGRARIEPACQKTLAEASDSSRRYETALRL